MRITMVKKRLSDGTECAKCADASAQLRARGLWERIDEIIWADEGDPASPGNELGRRFNVDRAPFFIVRDDAGEHVYTSVLKLIRERLGQDAASDQPTRRIDPDDIGI